MKIVLWYLAALSVPAIGCLKLPDNGNPEVFGLRDFCLVSLYVMTAIGLFASAFYAYVVAREHKERSQ